MINVNLFTQLIQEGEGNEVIQNYFLLFNDFADFWIRVFNECCNVNKIYKYLKWGIYR